MMSTQRRIWQLILLYAFMAPVSSCTDSGDDVIGPGDSVAPSEWVLRNPSPSTNDYMEIVLFDDQTIIAATRFEVVSTESGGTEWRTFSIADAEITTLARGGDHLFLATPDGHIYRSANRGNDWNEVGRIKGAVSVRKIAFRDELLGISREVSGNVHLTTDGGASWSRLFTLQNSSLEDFAFPRDDVIVGVGTAGTVMRSTDGGRTWTAQQLVEFTTLNAVSFVGSTGWIVGNGGKVFKSTNSGATWSSQTSGATENLRDVVFVTDRLGYAVGQDGVSIATANAGVSWVALDTGSKESLLTVAATSSGVAWAAGQRGALVNGRSAGTRWASQRRGSTRRLHAVAMGESGVGVAVGADGTVIKTEDSGRNWTTIENCVVSCNDFEDVFMINAEQFVIASSDGDMLRTRDGGETWERQHVAKIHFLGVAFSDAERGFAVGSDGGVATTTDGGQTWTPMQLGTADLFDVGFADERYGFIVGDAGTCFRTTDAGETWVPLDPLGDENLIGIAVTGRNSAIVIGTMLVDGNDLSAWYRTGNAGLTWQRDQRIVRPFVQGIAMNGTRGITVCQTGAAYTTTDAGETWTPFDSPTSFSLHGVALTRSGSAIAVGFNGTILETRVTGR